MQICAGNATRRKYPPCANKPYTLTRKPYVLIPQLLDHNPGPSTVHMKGRNVFYYHAVLGNHPLGAAVQIATSVGPAAPAG